jgi:hypothetical protein
MNETGLHIPKLEFKDHNFIFQLRTKDFLGRPQIEELEVQFLADRSGRFAIKHKFHVDAVDATKSMGAPTYHGFQDPSRRYWTVANDYRTAFTVNYFAKGFPNPYDFYRAPDIEVPMTRENLRDYQIEMVRRMFTKKKKSLRMIWV